MAEYNNPVTTPNLPLRQPIFASASRATFGSDLATDDVLFHARESWVTRREWQGKWDKIRCLTFAYGKAKA